MMMVQNCNVSKRGGGLEEAYCLSTFGEREREMK